MAANATGSLQLLAIITFASDNDSPLYYLLRPDINFMTIGNENFIAIPPINILQVGSS